jgi:quinol-cytochrome oxidoreductase complex cytochrome b subunit
MSRQLFIHHYLPSHLASALVAGAVLHFLLSETIEYPISVLGHLTRRRPRQWAELGTRAPIIVVISFVILFAAFVYLAPITYGTPGYAFHPCRSLVAAQLTFLPDWKAIRSTLNDCYLPGHFTLLPNHTNRSDREEYLGGVGVFFFTIICPDYCPEIVSSV